jgi:putative nucleotidyltransferase with HDIG domain
MIATLHSRFLVWWAWCMGRHQSPTAEAATRVEEHTRPAPVAAVSVPEVPAGAAVGRHPPTESPAALTQSLLEIVRLPALPLLEPTVSTTTANHRDQTLASLANLQQIPSLQSLARGFAEATNRDDASVAEVVEAVQKDPALCVRVLRMANSAFIRPAQRIEDIHSAVHMLGVLRVRKLAQAMFTMRDAPTAAGGFDWRHLWIHGLATAALADELERLLGLPANPKLYLAALLHDVGKIVLSTVSPDQYRSVLIAAWNGRQRLEILEESQLGVRHGEAGAIFARQCGLGPEVLAAIVHHADPENATDEPLTVAVVNVANFVAKTYGLGFSGARLDESDGEFETLPAWKVIAAQTGREPDPGSIADDLRPFVDELKIELKTMRELG